MAKRKSSIKKYKATSGSSKKVSDNLVSVTANQNTVLANGKFVAEGETVKISKEYAQRMKSEKDTHFIIND